MQRVGRIRSHRQALGARTSFSAKRVSQLRHVVSKALSNVVSDSTWEFVCHCDDRTGEMPWSGSEGLLIRLRRGKV